MSSPPAKTPDANADVEAEMDSELEVDSEVKNPTPPPVATKSSAPPIPPGPPVAAPIKEAEGKPFPRAKVIGLAAGPLAAVTAYLTLPDSLNPSATFVASIAILMAIWWMTEAIPLAATSLIPIVVFPFVDLLAPDENGVLQSTGESVGVATVLTSYSNKLVYLFFAGFIIALAMQRWNLHRRFALNIIARSGTNSAMIIGGFMLACALISMWVSNTATAIMLMPVAMAVIGMVTKDGKEDRNFAVALLLGVAYASSIGSLGTIIGTPPNVVLVGFLSENLGINISFLQWMAFGVPIALVFLIITWFVLTKVVFPPAFKNIPAGRQALRGELKSLGRMRLPEFIVLIAFGCAAAGWITFGALKQSESFVAANPWVVNVDDSVIGMVVALALFIIPVNSKWVRALDWETMKELPWGILLLFGGGLALSAQFSQTGLSAWIGESVSGIGDVPMFVVLLVVVGVVVLLTELTSNTATTNAFLPVIAGVAVGLGIDEITLLIPAALAATMAFMLPVATPPNAIVFGSGKIRIGQMVRAGVILNVLAVAVIMIAMYTVISWQFGFSF